VHSAVHIRHKTRCTVAVWGEGQRGLIKAIPNSTLLITEHPFEKYASTAEARSSLFQRMMATEPCRDKTLQ